jgi:hypothetical protein
MAVDAASECLVRLALDADFNQQFTTASESARRELIRTNFPGMSDPLVEAFATRKSTPIAEFIFNQQTSVASSESIASTLRALLAAVESGKKQV